MNYEVMNYSLISKTFNECDNMMLFIVTYYSPPPNYSVISYARAGYLMLTIL